MGAGIDGVFTLSISLMWAEHVSLELAILLGGSILAARRLSEILVAPFAGIIADRFGARLPLTIAVVASIIGFAMIGMNWLDCGVMPVGHRAWCLGHPICRCRDKNISR